jgi:hypothetical protein
MNSEAATSQGSEMEDQIKTYQQFCDFWGFDMNGDNYKDIHNSYVEEAEKSFYSPPSKKI